MRHMCTLMPATACIIVSFGVGNRRLTLPDPPVRHPPMRHVPTPMPATEVPLCAPFGRSSTTQTMPHQSMPLTARNRSWKPVASTKCITLPPSLRLLQSPMSHRRKPHAPTHAPRAHADACHWAACVRPLPQQQAAAVGAVQLQAARARAGQQHVVAAGVKVEQRAGRSG